MRLSGCIILASLSIETRRNLIWIAIVLLVIALALYGHIEGNDDSKGGPHPARRIRATFAYTRGKP